MDTTDTQQFADQQIPHTLIVDLSDNFGGANARILALMKSFPTNCIGLATIRGSRIASELEVSGYLVHYVGDNKFDPRIPFRMARIIRSNGYQVVDTQNPQSKLWGSVAALLSGASLVSTLNSWYMNEHPRFSLRWFIYSLIEFLTNFNLSRYIVVSREIKNDMLHWGISENKIDLIYNAVELDDTTITGDIAPLLEKLNIPRNAVICLAAGRLTWAKGHDDLICAIKMAREQNQNFYCLIAGEGSLECELLNQIRKLDMERYVFLVGHLNHNDLLSLLKACSIYVMPSRSEGTPIALLEAAALGKPIVATQIGGIPELVENEINALLVQVGDITSLANAMLKIALDPAYAFHLGQKAKEKTLNHFSLTLQARATAESYKKAGNS